MHDRTNLAALADRLIYGSERTFCRADAVALLGSLPRASFRSRALALLPALSVRGSVPGLGLSGMAAGVGLARMDGERREIDIDTHGRLCVRAGQWRLYRLDSAIFPWRTIVRIEQVMTDGDDDRTARIIFHRGHPITMQLYRGVTLPLLLVSLQASWAGAWKTPADD